MNIAVENIKCNGCGNSIKKSLSEINGVSNVQVHVSEGIIEVEADENLRSMITSKLNSLGYPEAGNNDLLKKAKSFVSCAVGRMSSEG